MKKILCLISATVLGAAVWAQTNSPAPAPRSQELGVNSDHGYFDENARQVVYYDHVVVTNASGRLTCERLTINLPPESSSDSHPTNIIAETNLDVVYINKKGETNHLTADKGIYDYSVVNGITNETCTFTGHATNTSAQGWFSGEPLVWDNVKGRFDFGSHPDMHFKMPGSSGNASNASPFNFMK